MEFFRFYGKTANKNRSAWMPAVAALLFVWYGCVVLAQETPFAQGTNADTEGSFLASPAPLNSSGPLALPENPHPSDSQLLAPSDPPQNVSAGLAAPTGTAPAAPAAPAGTAPAQIPAAAAPVTQAATPAQPNPYLPLMCRPEHEGTAAVGEDRSLEDILRGVSSPQERFRLTDAYWQLTGELIRCNLAAVYANDVASCVCRYQGQAMGSNAEALWVSAKRLADEAKRDARVAFVTAQYRCAALARRSAAAFRPEMLPVPTDPPTVEPYNTRAEEIARNRTFTARASMLNQRIPYQYNALCAYRAAVAESLSAFAALYNDPNCSAPQLLAALKRHTDDKRKMLESVILYNRLIAEYVAETVGPQIQGDRLLMTFNQYPKNRTADPAYRMADNRGTQIIRGQEFQPAPRGQVSGSANTRPSIPARQAPQHARPGAATILRSSTPAAANPALESTPPPALLAPGEPAKTEGLTLPFEIPSARRADTSEEMIIRGQMPDAPSAGGDLILPDIVPADSGGGNTGAAPEAGGIVPPQEDPLPPQSAAPGQDLFAPPQTAAPAQNPLPPQEEPFQQQIPPQNALPQTAAPPQNNLLPQNVQAPQTPQVDLPQFAPSQTVPSALPPDGNPAPPAEVQAPPSGAPAGGTSATYAKPRSEQEKAQILRQTRSLSDLLFSIKSTTSGAGEGDILEIPLSLGEMLSRVGDPRLRIEAVDSYWHLRTQVASLAVENKILETVDRLIASMNSASAEARAVIPTIQSYRQGTLGRIAELRGEIRAAQMELMRRSGRTPDVGWPIPSSTPCHGPYNLESGSSPSVNFEILTQTVLIPEKIDAVWDTAVSLGPPESLFVPEIAPDGTVDGTYCYLDILENKRLAVMTFLDEIESLNGSIVRYVDAFSPTALPSETYVHCLTGE